MKPSTQLYWVSVALAFVLISMCGPVRSAESDDPMERSLTKEERILGLVTFYQSVRQHFAGFERVPDLDWDKAFLERLPLVEKGQSTYEYYRLLQEYAALLMDGHTDVEFPPSVFKTLDRLPLRFEFIQAQWVVTERFPTRDLLKEDIAPGSVLLSIDECDPTGYFSRRFFPYISAPRKEQHYTKLYNSALFLKNEEVRVELRSPDGKRHSRVPHADFKSIEWTNARARKYIAPLRRAPSFRAEKLAEGVLYVRYGRCDAEVERQFSELIRSIRDSPPKAMVLDLRNNPGGSTPIETVQHLISAPISWYRFKTRCSISYLDAQNLAFEPNDPEQEQWLKEKREFMGLPEQFGLQWFVVTDQTRKIAAADSHFDGPLVLLVNGETGSAAEDLTVLLHAAKRATVIGERTAGSTGQPLVCELPGGGRARICTANCRYPDGREFVGPGVIPDVLVERSIAAVAKGSDEVLDVALKHIREKR